MRNIIVGMATVMTISFSLSAFDISDEQGATNAASLSDAIFNQLEQNGDLLNADAATQFYAKVLVRDMVNDPELLQDYQNGDLVLNEEFVANYFLKATIEKIGSGIKDVGGKIFDTVKDIAGGIASLANKALSAVTNSEIVMKFVSTATGVVNKLIPFGANALGLALLAIPGAEVLIPVVAAATPVLMKVVTPTNVTAALKIAAATANVADAFINQAKKDGVKLGKTQRAPSAELLSLEKKAKGSPSSKDRDAAGEAYHMGLQGSDALNNYVKKLGAKGWDKLDKDTKAKITAALNKSAAMLPLVDPKKLK